MTRDDFGFDPADTELARQLNAAAPPAGDADAVLAGLRPRLARARRRRHAGLVAIATTAVILLAGVAFAATGPRDGAKVRVPPAHPAPSIVDTVPAPTPPTTISNGQTTTPTSPPPTATTPTTIDDHGGNRGPGGSDDSEPDDSGSHSGSGSNSGSGSGSSGSGGGSGDD